LKEEEELRRAFTLIDADQDGIISRLEFVNAVRRNPVVASLVLPNGGVCQGDDELCFDIADEAFDIVSDGKRRICLQDFVLHFRRRAREAKREAAKAVSEARAMFDLIDVDRSGAISKLEFVKALVRNAKLERFLLPGSGGAQLLDNEKVFDTANLLFKSMAGGRRHIDFQAFQRYCRSIGSESGRSPLPSSGGDRASRCVFAMSAGLRVGQHVRLACMLEAAGFRIYWCDAPAPDGPGWSALPHLGIIAGELAEVKPDVLLCASVGGAYVMPLWQAGLWDGPTVLINAHPSVNSVPPDLPFVIAHGSNDQVFPTPRAFLEDLASIGGNCFLYFTGNSGRLPSGHLSRLGDGHEMESLLQYDCLPRLVDSALCPEGPETHMLRSWRHQLTDARSKAEQWLGFTPHSFQQRWAPLLPDGGRRLLADVPQSSEEFRCVEAAFKENPKEMPAYTFANTSQEQWDARRVLRVQRVENVFQADNNARPYFTALQQSLEQQGVAFEPGTHTCWAFHGAAPAALESILTNPVAGFQPLASGTRGASLWGPGTYYARDARYVCDGGFCHPAPDGTRQMLMCMLATGIPCLGDPSHIGVLPFRQRPHRYNSSVDSLSCPEVYIIQHAGAALPCYLITFA